MKNIYLSTVILLILFSASAMGQSRIYPPTLRMPENGQIGQYPNVLLDWDAVTGQTTNITYEVQLATTPDFSDAITFPKTEYTALKMEELQFAEYYYWRVKAYDDNDPSEWSEMWMFKVVAAVTVTDPDIGDEQYVNPVIEWEPITGLTKYQLQVDTSYFWKVQDAGTSDKITGVYAISMDDMWMVGAGGLIQHYDGTMWSPMDAGITDDLASVFFVSSDNGYAVGEGGTIIHYNGVEWSSMDAGITEDLTGVSFADVNNGWAVGLGGAITQYSSGTWSPVTTSVTADLYSVSAVSVNDVWACGKGKVVVHYNGTDWTSEEVGTRDWASVSFSDAANGWIVGKGGKIMYYNGLVWTEEDTPTNKDLYAVSFSDMTGYAVGKDGVMVTYDGEWQLAASGSDKNLNAVWITQDIGLTAGDAGTTVIEVSSGFDSPYAKTIQIGADKDSYQLENLLYGQSIYYRMRAIHSQDTSSWSGGREFITYKNVTLSKPTNNTSNTDMLVKFEWKKYDGSSDYHMEIDMDENFSEALVIVSDSTSAFVQAKYFGQKYYWRVNAENALYISDWSDTWSITTVDAVVLDAPSNSATDVATCPRYTWDAISGVAGYQIWIDTDENFSNPVKEVVNVPFFQCNSPLKRQTNYYWKVRAFSTIDTSNFSPVWSFKTEGYTGIEDEFNSTSVDIYPNPANNTFNITINSYSRETYKISIVELTGKTIYEEEVESNSGEYSKEYYLPGLQSGLYLVRINAGNRSVTKKLFIK